MNQPVRIQLSRRKGWRLPENTVVVSRPTKWGNPFRVHSDGTGMDAENAVACFRSMVTKEGGWIPVALPWPCGKVPMAWTSIEDVKRELRGKNLACWCPLDQPCHADVLLELANK
jgi:hypothetical protein